MIVAHAKLYGHIEKANTSFEIINETFCLFLGMLLLSGCRKLPDRKINWETTPDTFVQAMPDSIPGNTFKRILRNLHPCNNEQLDKTNSRSSVS